MNVELVIALAGAVGAVAKLAHARWVRTQGLAAALQAEHDIHEVLRALRIRLGAVRATVLEAHNGGSIPRVGARLASSARWEDHDTAVRSLCDSWQDVRLDASAVNILLGIVLHGERVTLKGDLRPGIVRDLFEADDVAASVSIAIDLKPAWWRTLIPGSTTHWTWLCVDWQAGHLPTSVTRAKVEARDAAAKIRAILHGKRVES